jgi:hypothetical protein
VTTPPNFDELVGSDLERGERDRLREVHDLLLTAGPPAELPPHLEAGPTLAMTLARRKHRPTRRLALLAAALCVLAVVFLGGYAAGNNGGSIAGSRTVDLHGTAAAPHALASLRIAPADAAGNWPMTLSATGLPRLGPKDYFEVYLYRNGKLFAPCGTFVAKTGTEDAVLVKLNAPYELKPGDTWVITQHAWDEPGAGRIVLRPTT